ncbi:PRTRC system protein E [Sediminibacterium ginsengisoli]|uniref:PRTRC system protein E n=1 Tax=Sediminibacterium ginsengisoli TaxID=413434 RepID=A0A1T4P1S4_9BACT|nr:PRTRC system protein E [Sediminibacterium ginsengisoli]SJZ85226.1 PRTRC system protein E [Sediminibacterium ginsengisoli]
METNFFTIINDLNLTGNLRINIILQQDKQMIVTVLLDSSHIKDKAASMIVPLVLRGASSDLDAGFFKEIKVPLHNTTTLLQNLEAHEKSIENAQKKSRQELEKQDSLKKEKSSKQKKFDEQMKKVDDLYKQKKIGEAIGQLPDIKQYPEFEAEIRKKSQELRSQHNALSLFAADEEADPVTDTVEDKQPSQEEMNDLDEEEFIDDDPTDETAPF